MKMNKKQLLEAVTFSIEVAQEAGKKLTTYQKKLGTLTVSPKKAQGVVSEADVEAEKLIIKKLTKQYPLSEFLAEESFFASFKNDKAALEHYAKIEWLWVIDPLDGTTNFLNNMDYYAVCISLLHFGKPVTGVVFRPATGDCFFASMGNGAFHQNLKSGQRKKSIKSDRNAKRLKDALLVTGFATEKGKVFDQEFATFKSMMEQSRGIRRMGSAALDLCYVANGTFDGFWERGLAPWDVAAAGLICIEAKVKLTNYKGESFSPFAQTILGARNPLYRVFSSGIN